MKQNLLTLWRLMEGQRLRYVAAIAATVVATGFRYLNPVIVMVALDYVIVGKNPRLPAPLMRYLDNLGGREALAGYLWVAAAAVVGVTLVAGFFSFLRGRLAAQATEAAVQRLRDRLFVHLHSLPCAFYDDHETGDLVQRCTSDVETVRLFLSTQIVELGRAVILLGSAAPILILMDWRMGLLSMTIAPILVISSTLFFIAVRQSFQRMDESEGRMTAMLQENINGIRVVRAFSRQSYEIEKFACRNDEYRHNWYCLAKLMSWFWPTTDVLCILQIALVVLVGGRFVIGGEMTVGQLFFYLSVVNMLIWPIRQSGRILADLGKALVATGRLDEILGEEEETDPPSPVLPTPFIAQGDIELRGLSFAHGSTPVLHDLSLRIEAGQTLAILGPSGSGKTTLLSLLLRLYDYDVGEIFLDGREIRSLPRRVVRQQFGVVPQEPFLFSRTLRDNITLTHRAAREEDVVHVASTAHIHDTIVGWDEGYDTMVGEKGVTLSGGQRQRVALARALLSDPPIVIFDDALSAIDTRTEAMIMQALAERHGRRTTIVIAHRLTTLRKADTIIVLDGGRIAQAGSHSELIAIDGLYSRLWRLQGAVAQELPTVDPP